MNVILSAKCGWQGHDCVDELSAGPRHPGRSGVRVRGEGDLRVRAKMRVGGGGGKGEGDSGGEGEG